MVAGCGLGAQAPAWAQSDPWSFVLTPQVWISHIAKNGFASSPDATTVGPFFVFDQAGNINQAPFPSTSSPNESLNPQWGMQFAAQKGRWTFATAFQYVTFETRNDLTYNGSQLCVTFCINSGERWAQEFVDTTRMDVDLSASYFFPDVVKDWVDVSLGAGFKFIYASASREFANLSPTAAVVSTEALNLSPSKSPGLYTICVQDDCSDANGRSRVKQQSYLYGATFPMSATLHLTRDAKWLLPFSITPLIGAETRNDHNIVYSLTAPANISDLATASFKVNRQDGTKLRLRRNQRYDRPVAHQRDVLRLCRHACSVHQRARQVPGLRPSGGDVGSFRGSDPASRRCSATEPC